MSQELKPGQCSKDKCTNKTNEVPQYYVPCVNPACTSEAKILVGSEICSVHKKEIEDLLLDNHNMKLISIALFRQENANCVPDFSKARINWILTSGAEYELYKKMKANEFVIQSSVGQKLN